MSFLLQQMLGDKLKNMTGGGNTDGEEKEGGKETAASKGMSREEFEEYQKQLIKENRVMNRTVSLLQNNHLLGIFVSTEYCYLS
uniref:Uncharacterized protein n=1 Tax=Sinocyclocheilus rhinocerous TaxID=307959 RepID=A0A673FR32_9TELE